MQVHHGFDEQHVGAHAVNDGVGETVEVELAVIAPEDAPAFGFLLDAAQRGNEGLEEIVAEAGLALFSYQSAAASNS